jgi:hypothetical protein
MPQRQSRRDYERNCGRQPFTNIVDVKAAVGLPNSVAYRGVDATTGKAICDIATLTSPTFRKLTIDNLRSRWQAQFGLTVSF